MISGAERPFVLVADPLDERCLMARVDGAARLTEADRRGPLLLEGGAFLLGKTSAASTSVQ